MPEAILAFGFQTDIGKVRDHNEDATGYRLSKDRDAESKGNLFVIADGMGGHAAGEVASKLAVDVVTDEYFKSSSTNTEYSLKNAVEKANRRIFEEASQNPEKMGMGTTVVCALFKDNDIFLAHVGDSRAYRLRGDNLTQLTTDHSWVQTQISSGYLSKEEAKFHPMRNVLTRALGTSPSAEIDLAIYPLQEDDTFILCTDGLTGEVEDEAIKDIVKANPDSSKAAQQLVDAANALGGPDNISVIVIRVKRFGQAEEEIEKNKTVQPKRGLIGFSAVGAALVLVATMLVATSGRVLSPSLDETPSTEPPQALTTTIPADNALITAQPNAGEPTETQSPRPVYGVAKFDFELQKEPNLESDKLATVGEGTTFLVLGDADNNLPDLTNKTGWYLVRISTDISGWANSDWIEEMR